MEERGNFVDAINDNSSDASLTENGFCAISRKDLK